MDLKPLPNKGDVSAKEFTELFEARLGDIFSRAMKMLVSFGEMYSFSFANLIHLGLQKGNASEVIEGFEKWWEVVQHAPDFITAHVDTRKFIDIMYGELFMTPDDTLSGMGPFVNDEQDPRIKRIKPKQPELWVPGQ